MDKDASYVWRLSLGRLLHTLNKLKIFGDYVIELRIDHVMHVKVDFVMRVHMMLLEHVVHLLRIAKIIILMVRIERVGG